MPMDEIQSLLDTTNSLKDFAILSLLYKGGLRSGELNHIKRQDVTYDEHGALLNVDGSKNNPYTMRRIRIMGLNDELKQIFEEEDAPFDFSHTYLRKVIRKAKKRAGIKRRIYPHLFRHTRATHLGKHLTDREMCLFFGWSPDSDMPQKYVHLSGRDVDQKIISLSHLE